MTRTEYSASNVEMNIRDAGVSTLFQKHDCDIFKLPSSLPIALRIELHWRPNEYAVRFILVEICVVLALTYYAR